MELGIAFVLLSVNTLALVTAITTRVTIVRLRRPASATMEREVQNARVEVEQALAQVEQDVTFLSDVFLTRLLSGIRAPPDSVRGVLESFMPHTASLFRRKVIRADGSIVFAAGSPRPPPPYEQVRERAMLEFFRHYVRRLLDFHGGNISRAATAAGVSRRTVHRWLADLGHSSGPEP